MGLYDEGRGEKMAEEAVNMVEEGMEETIGGDIIRFPGLVLKSVSW